MSDLYIHEIPCPEDRSIRKFLWNSFFHDAVLDRIEYGMPDRRDVTLIARFGSAQLLPEYASQSGTYLLRFHRLHHFQYVSESRFLWGDAICSTCFLDTPLLRRMQTKSRRALYHLRVCTFAGFIDMVFERFSIRKENGRVNYRGNGNAAPDDWDAGMAALAQHINAQYADTPDEALPTDALDDVQRVRLYQYQRAGDASAAVVLSRRILREPPMTLYNAEGYAAYLLGLHGDASDLPALRHILTFPECDPYHRQIMQDAMERIAERTLREVSS